MVSSVEWSPEFLRIPRCIYQTDAPLGPQRLLGLLCAYAATGTQTDVAYPTVETICKLLGRSRRTIYRDRQWLEMHCPPGSDKPYLEVSKMWEGKWQQCVYILHEWCLCRKWHTKRSTTHPTLKEGVGDPSCDRDVHHRGSIVHDSTCTEAVGFHEWYEAQL